MCSIWNFLFVVNPKICLGRTPFHYAVLHYSLLINQSNRAHSKKGTFQKEHIPKRAHSKKGIFQKEHIPKRAHSKKSTFQIGLIPKMAHSKNSTFQKGHIPNRAHSKYGTLQKEHIQKGVKILGRLGSFLEVSGCRRLVGFKNCEFSVCGRLVSVGS